MSWVISPGKAVWCQPDKPALVFFSCEMSVNMARKAWFEVCGESLYPVFNPEKKSAFKQKLTCA